MKYCNKHCFPFTCVTCNGTPADRYYCRGPKYRDKKEEMGRVPLQIRRGLEQKLEAFNSLRGS